MTKEKGARKAGASVTSRFGDALSELEVIIANDPELRWEYEARSLKLGLAVELYRIRRELGMSQHELATATGTTQPMVSRFFSEEDDSSPTLETIVKLADALGKRLEVSLVDRTAPASSWPAAAVAEDSTTGKPCSCGRKLD